jgi:hypothetical protein
MSIQPIPSREPVNDFLEIRMQQYETDCSLCGLPTEHRWGIPTFNGDIVSNDFPDDLWRGGGGNIPACRECFAKHARGEIPTFDRFYVPQTLMGVHLVNGAGI